MLDFMTRLMKSARTGAIQDGWKGFGLKIFLSSSCQQTFQENCVLETRARENLTDGRRKKETEVFNISSKRNKLCYIGGHHVAALDRKTLVMKRFGGSGL